MEITIERRWYGPDAEVMRGGLYNPDVVKESHTFTSAHDALAFIREVGEFGNLHRADGWLNAWGLECEVMRSWRIRDRAVWEYLAAVHQRHRRFTRYLAEREWETVEGSRTYWADNSIDVLERHRITGATRVRTVVAPHGDIC